VAEGVAFNIQTLNMLETLNSNNGGKVRSSSVKPKQHCYSCSVSPICVL